MRNVADARGIARRNRVGMTACSTRRQRAEDALENLVVTAALSIPTDVPVRPRDLQSLCPSLPPLVSLAREEDAPSSHARCLFRARENPHRSHGEEVRHQGDAPLRTKSAFHTLGERPFDGIVSLFPPKVRGSACGKGGEECGDMLASALQRIRHDDVIERRRRGDMHVPAHGLSETVQVLQGTGGSRLDGLALRSLDGRSGMHEWREVQKRGVSAGKGGSRVIIRVSSRAQPHFRREENPEELEDGNAHEGQHHSQYLMRKSRRKHLGERVSLFGLHCFAETHRQLTNGELFPRSGPFLCLSRLCRSGSSRSLRTSRFSARTPPTPFPRRA